MKTFCRICEMHCGLRVDFDAEGAIRLHEKLLKLPGGFNIPFLSTHPSSEERIENLKKLIAEKKCQLKQDPALNP